MLTIPPLFWLVHVVPPQHGSPSSHQAHPDPAGLQQTAWTASHCWLASQQSAAVVHDECSSAQHAKSFPPSQWHWSPAQQSCGAPQWTPGPPQAHDPVPSQVPVQHSMLPPHAAPGCEQQTPRSQSAPVVQYGE